MSGCPRCAGKHTDSIAALFPEIAKEAFGWDANLCTPGASTILTWSCKVCYTEWEASPKQRVRNPLSWGCPTCYGEAGKYREVCGQKVRIPKKSNSLLDKYPSLAKELVDPGIALLVGYGSNAIVWWHCSKCCTDWKASVQSRTSNGNGCPVCAKTGFSSNEAGFVYLLEASRRSERIIQYGITKDLKQRCAYHKRSGFQVPNGSNFLKFPNGQDALDVENEIKVALARLRVPSIKDDPNFTDKFKGYSESFRKELLPVESLTELLESLGIDFAKRECELVPVASLLGSEKRPLNK